MRLDITETDMVASHVLRDQQRKNLVPNDDEEQQQCFSSQTICLSVETLSYQITVRASKSWDCHR